MAIKRELTSKYESAWSDADVLLLSLDTGSWRTERPVVDMEKCTYCWLCVLYCPPQCIINAEDRFIVDLDFCKGCGICSKECNLGAITMVAEGEFAYEGTRR